MGHWHRPPRVTSVRSMIQRYAACIFIDRAIKISISNFKALSKDVQAVSAIDPEEKLTLTHIVRLCQEMHALLITTDTEAISMLITEGRVPWGVVLVSHERTARVNVLQKLAANELVASPLIKQGSGTEYILHNRLLIDLRSSSPTIGMFSHLERS